MDKVKPNSKPETLDAVSTFGGRRPSFCYAPPMMSNAEEWLFLSLGVASFALLLNFDFRVGIAYGFHFVGRCIQSKPLRENRAHNEPALPEAGRNQAPTL
jgi:hypothetical protein